MTQVGDWLHVNGDAIYGVRSTPYGDLPWGVCTHRPGKLYLHLFELPSQDTLFLPGLKSSVKQAYFLADEKRQALDIQTVDGGLKIDLTRAKNFAQFTNEHDTVIAGRTKPSMTSNAPARKIHFPVVFTDLSWLFRLVVFSTQRSCHPFLRCHFLRAV